MSVRFACRLAAGFATGMMAIQSCGAGPYVGLGASRLSLSSDYASIDGRSEIGFTLFGGYELASTWFAELAVSAATMDTGPTLNIFYPADSAEYSILRLSVGKRLWPVSERRWTPWLGAGAAYHYVNWDTFYYQLDGTGLSLGAGVDFELAQSWLVRVQALRHRFSARDTYGDGPYSSRSSELSAAVIYAFR